MTRDRHGREEALDADAMSYALDLLDGEERRAFEERLLGSPALRGAALRAQEAAGLLAEALPPLPPPASVKARLFARVHAATSASGIHDVRAGAGTWEATGVPGVSVKRLRHDPTTGLSTMLVRMEPGATYPAHRHTLAEQCLVLKGDVRSGEDAWAEGDFVWADEGSEHQALHTAGGNLLLIVGSASNEFATVG